MKKIIFPLLMILALITACKKDEVQQLEVADFEVAIAGEAKSTAFKVAIDDYLTFLDVSRNATSHEWRIDDGNFFISDLFTTTDSIYDEFILPDAGKVSTEIKVNILFKEAGLQPIQIVNTFAAATADGPATAVQQGSEWVVDTTYMVDVFANIQAAFKVFKGAEEVLSVSASETPDVNNIDSWPTVEIEAGESLTFVDVTTEGRPNNRNWRFPGAVPETSTDSVATINYFSLGVYDAGVFFSERSGDLPEQTQVKVIPIKVKVNASTQPFLYEGNMTELVDETITFNLGGEVAPFNGQEGAFTVQVVNDSIGFNETISVQLAKVSDSDATKIELKLAAPIYNSDRITVSYSGDEIKSQDFRTLSPFGPETVAMHFEDNILPSEWAGFETEDANWKKAFCLGFWVGNSNGDELMPHYARTTDLFASGTASMKLDLYNGMENKTLQGADFNTFGLTAGDYLISFKLYLDPANTMVNVQTFEKASTTTMDWDITNSPRGEWVEFSTPFTAVVDLTDRFDFKVAAAANPGITDPQILYIDDYSWVPYEKRP